MDLDWQHWGGISGADPDLNPGIVPTADPDLRGGERLDLGVGVTFLVKQGQGSQGLRLALEGGLPIYQSLDGPGVHFCGAEPEQVY